LAALAGYRADSSVDSNLQQEWTLEANRFSNGHRNNITKAGVSTVGFSPIRGLGELAEADLMWSVPYLARFIDEIVKRGGRGRVDVVAYSLGVRGAVQALARMAYREASDSILNELVLVAPDIDTAIFQQELPLIRKTALRITVYASDNDKALKVSHDVHGYPRLGMAGEYLTVLEGVETIDVSPLEMRRFSGHIYHLFNPEVTEDLTRLLCTGKPAGQRPGLQAAENNGLPFWRLVQ
jgi:esterase/lipase superfamily enzyme